jgi:hypothetical protein
LQRITAVLEQSNIAFLFIIVTKWHFMVRSVKIVSGKSLFRKLSYPERKELAQKAMLLLDSALCYHNKSVWM